MRKVHSLLILLLTLSLLLRLARIDYPKDFVFDEVYYGFTAQEYLNGNPDAWSWWTSAPEGRAFAWVNPPLPQEIMATSMFIFNTKEAWAFRFPSVLMGVLSIYLVFSISRILFKQDAVALLSAFIFSLDGLNFVQSRTGMLDIYLVTFILLSLLFFLKKNIFLSAVFLGLAISSKWTAAYFAIILLIWLLKYKRLKDILMMIVIPIVIYLLVYIPFFTTGHNVNQFIELIKQEIWYHTNLKATHDFASPWWSWPLNLYPIWYFVDYSGNKMANIFSGGNPAVFWGGTLAVIFSIFQIIQKKFIKNLLIVLMCFFLFWLPWATSNRIMFLYYFAPAVPFMSMAFGYQLEKLYSSPKNRSLFSLILTAIITCFLLFYPFYTGLALPKEWVQFFFFTNLAKNPFI